MDCMVMRDPQASRSDVGPCLFWLLGCVSVSIRRESMLVEWWLQPRWWIASVRTVWTGVSQNFPAPSPRAPGREAVALAGLTYSTGPRGALSSRDSGQTGETHSHRGVPAMTEEDCWNTSSPHCLKGKEVPHTVSCSLCETLLGGVLRTLRAHDL